MDVIIRIKLRLRMTIITSQLLKGCPVRKRGGGALMLSDIEVWNVSLKCHLGKYKTRFGTIKCNSVQLSDEWFL